MGVFYVMNKNIHLHFYHKIHLFNYEVNKIMKQFYSNFTTTTVKLALHSAMIVHL